MMYGELAETYYSILGVNKNCTYLEIKQKFKAMIKALHPDKNPSYGETDKKKYLDLQDAWRILSNETTRQMYDEQIERLQLEELLLINEEIILSDMDTRTDDTSTEMCEYTYQCRCGGYYNLDATFITTNLSYVILPCESCSLNIKVFCQKLTNSPWI